MLLVWLWRLRRRRAGLCVFEFEGVITETFDFNDFNNPFGPGGSEVGDTFSGQFTIDMDVLPGGGKGGKGGEEGLPAGSSAFYDDALVSISFSVDTGGPLVFFSSNAPGDVTVVNDEVPPFGVPFDRFTFNTFDFLGDLGVDLALDSSDLSTLSSTDLPSELGPISQWDVQNFFSFSTNGGSLGASGNLTSINKIPTPGALSLAGLACVAATRRRR